MARKSNKTAHVLGLITNEKPPAQDGDAEISEKTEAPKPSRRTVVRKATPSLINNSQETQNELSENIREKLLEELDGPAPPPPLSQTLEEDTQILHEQNPVKDQTTDIIAAALDEAYQVGNGQLLADSKPTEYSPADNMIVPPFVPQTIQSVVADYPLEDFGAPMEQSIAVEKPILVNTAVPDAPQDPYLPHHHASYTYINVLEELVKEQALNHMQSNGVCMCNRCVMDTMALALTRLPSKYVVIEKGEGIPLLNYYGIYYQVQVVSELTKACMIVKASPHH